MTTEEKNYLIFNSLFLDWSWLTAEVQKNDAQFVDRLGPWLADLSKMLEFDRKNELDKIIQEARCLSHGVNSITNDLLIPNPATPLCSPFSGLNNTIEKKYNIPGPLDISMNNSFPVSKSEYDESTDHLQKWSSNLDNIQQEFLEFVANTTVIDASCQSAALQLLFRFGSKLPGQYRFEDEVPDLSVYTLSKIRTAIALSLCDYTEKTSTLDTKDELMMIGGTLSGIQKFIYNIPNKGAAKNLKGRSFFLQILPEVIIYELQRLLGFSATQTIYSSGGGFYLLAANTEHNRVEIDTLSATINQYLFERFDGSLFVALDSVTFPKQDLIHKKESKDSNRIKSVWASLSNKLSDKKKNKYSDIIQNNLDFFKPSQDRRDEKSRLFATQIAKIGKYLNKVSGLTIEYTIKKDSDWLNNMSSNDLMLLDLPHGYWSLDFTPEPGISRPVAVQVLTLFSEESQTKANYLYGGNYTPVRKNGLNKPNFVPDVPLEYDEIAKLSSGVSRLGVLRMDVDNLGWLFGSGFPDHKHSLARLSSLSAGLDYFFRGYLNAIFSENISNYTENTTHATYPKFRDKCILLYSGGDDLFCLGSWDAVWTLERIIRDKFSVFTGKHPKLTLSGGLVLVPGTFPISTAARLSNDEEANAKNHRFMKADKESLKNALSIFNTPLNAEYELNIVRALQEDLSTMLRSSGVGHNLITNIYSWYQIAFPRRSSERINHSWRWLSAYQISRIQSAFKDGDDSKGIKVWLTRLQNTLFEGTQYIAMDEKEFSFHGSSLDFLRYLSVAARIAELSSREH